MATPALSRVSDAKTDITKVHVQELGGIAHEMDQSSERLETRSDLISKVSSKKEPVYVP